jgi:hypothetical protein
MAEAPPASQGAAAGIGSARGLGASPAPDLRESARAVPTYSISTATEQ